MFTDWKTTVKMATVINLQIQCNPYQHSNRVFGGGMELEKPTLKFTQNCRRPRRVKRKLPKKKLKASHFPNSLLHNVLLGHPWWSGG